ncbi:MAG: FAD:protein FMN transferase [Vicinamibacterales bacterium]
MTRLAACLAVAACVAVSGAPGRAAQAGDTPLSSRVHRYLMGTSMTIEVYGGDPKSRADAIDEAFASMVEIDRLMSNYRDDSELAQINAHAAERPIRVSEPMWGVLSAAQLVSQRSGGAFDISVGPLVRLWGFHDKQPHVPTDAELRQVRPLVGYENVVLDAAAHTVAFRRSGVELDLGGIAKGFAVELAGGVLRRRGFAGLIDAGGNQYLVGHPIGKSAWQIGIEDPDQTGALLGVLDVDGGAVSTSGGYHNFFVADGKTYGHLLDPRSLQPSTSALSVTIVSPDATLADALSKPAFILGPAAGLRFVESFPGTMAIIASRSATGGGIDIVMSQALRSRFRRTKS